MHKAFYASGFLYNLKAHKILLLHSEQKDSAASSWSMLTGESREGEDAQITFQRVIQENLNIDLKVKRIYPIYDYFDEKLDRTNYVFYAEVAKKPTLDPSRENTWAWLTFPETIKLLFSANTKQDIIVGQRVIHLKEREIQEALDIITI